MKGGFDSLEVNDYIYFINTDDAVIIPCKVVNVKIQRTEEYDTSDRYEEPHYITRNCYKIHITFEGETTYNYSKVLTVDLTNSDIYKYYFANFYVYLDDAKEHLIDSYNHWISYSQKQIIDMQNKIADYEKKILKVKSIELNL